MTSDEIRAMLVHPAEARGLRIHDSPIEAALARLVLVDSPGLDLTARYVFLDGHEVFRDLLATAAQDALMPHFIIAPQLRIGDHRVDFALAARSPHAAPCPYAVAIIEADGAEWHSAPEQIARDMEREKAIRQETRWPILRFAGDEIQFRLTEVGDVLEAYVAALSAGAVSQPGSPFDDLRQQIVERVRDLTIHPALRHRYTEAACRPQLDRLRALFKRLREWDGEEP